PRRESGAGDFRCHWWDCATSWWGWGRQSRRKHSPCGTSRVEGGRRQRGGRRVTGRSLAPRSAKSAQMHRPHTRRKPTAPARTRSICAKAALASAPGRKPTPAEKETVVERGPAVAGGGRQAGKGILLTERGGGP